MYKRIHLLTGPWIVRLKHRPLQVPKVRVKTLLSEWEEKGLIKGAEKNESLFGTPPQWVRETQAPLKPRGLGTVFRFFSLFRGAAHDRSESAVQILLDSCQRPRPKVAATTLPLGSLSLYDAGPFVDLGAILTGSGNGRLNGRKR